MAESAKRFLGVLHGAEAVVAHRVVLEQVRAIARRRGDPRWRLLGVSLADRQPIDAAPPLDAWADAEGLDNWSEAERRALYEERFPTDEREARRSARNARLRAKRLALLHELETIEAQPARPTDRLDGWLAPELAERLQSLGDLTLDDLARRLRRGGRWWRSIRGFGKVKAERLAQHLAVLLPAGIESHLIAVTITPSALARLAGGPSEASAAQIAAANDREAVQAWIAARAGSTATAAVYQREAERFMLWAVIERHKPLSAIGTEDCRAYMDFITDVPDRWISRRRSARMAAGWAPFRGALGIASQRVALAALHSLFGWLTQARYLAGNPWALVNRSLGDDPLGDSPELAPSRAFTPRAWAALMRELARAGADPSTVRLRWLCDFGEATGLRAAELLRAQRGHFAETSGGWVLKVHGKGRKSRVVPVPARAMKATRAYFESRSLDFDRAPADAPLLAALDDGMRPVGYQALQASFKSFLKRAMRNPDLSDAERQAGTRASLHWLRHTHATRGAERGVPPDVQQANLGQVDPRTTARYYAAQLQRRQAHAERAFGEQAPER